MWAHPLLPDPNAFVVAVNNSWFSSSTLQRIPYAFGVSDPFQVTSWPTVSLSSKNLSGYLFRCSDEYGPYDHGKGGRDKFIRTSSRTYQGFGTRYHDCLCWSRISNKVQHTYFHTKSERFIIFLLSYGKLHENFWQWPCGHITVLECSPQSHRRFIIILHCVAISPISEVCTFVILFCFTELKAFWDAEISGVIMMNLLMILMAVSFIKQNYADVNGS